MIKYRLLVNVEYNGANYIGWQKQVNNKYSIQESIEKSLSIIANHKVNIYCSSRTDAGVHSIGQTFHFDTFSFRSKEDWIFGTNSILPKDISLKDIKYVSELFHARFDAVSRRYLYIICVSKIRSSFLTNLVTYYPYDVDISLMSKGAQFLIGEHNFNAFRSSKCQSLTPFRKVIHLNIYRKMNFIFFDIKANSFLYKMVRNIVSSLLLVGIKKYSFCWIKELLFSQDRSFGKFNTAFPYGLYLLFVEYKNINF